MNNELEFLDSHVLQIKNHMYSETNFKIALLEIHFCTFPQDDVGFNLNLLSNEILKFQLTGFPNYYLMKKEDHPETVREETILHTRSLEDDYKVCY